MASVSFMQEREGRESGQERSVKWPRQFSWGLVELNRSEEEYRNSPKWLLDLQCTVKLRVRHDARLLLPMEASS